MAERERCVERVWADWRQNRCLRYAVRDGYCKQHHPDAVAARAKASDERYRALEARRRKPYQDLARYRTFVELVANNPQGLGMAQLQERARKLLDG